VSGVGRLDVTGELDGRHVAGHTLPGNEAVARIGVGHERRLVVVGQRHFTDVHVDLDAVMLTAAGSIPGPSAGMMALPAEVESSGVGRVSNQIGLRRAGRLREPELVVFGRSAEDRVLGPLVRVVARHANDPVHLFPRLTREQVGGHGIQLLHEFGVADVAGMADAAVGRAGAALGEVAGDILGHQGVPRG